MEEITITREQFRKAVLDEMKVLLSTDGVDGMAGVAMGLLASMFGAALTNRLFDKKEEE